MRRRSITALAIVATLSAAVAVSFFPPRPGPVGVSDATGIVTPAESAGTNRETDTDRISLTMRRTEPDAARATSRADVALTGVADVLVLRSATRRRIVPEDFSIGPLADRYAGDTRVRSIRDVAARFVDDLGSTGSTGPTGAAFLPEARSDLLRRLVLDREAAPRVEHARIALPRFVDTDAAELEVLLFSREGQASGEIFLERVSGRWYVTGYTVDIESLARRYVRPQAKFEPSTSTRVMPGL